MVPETEGTYEAHVCGTPTECNTRSSTSQNSATGTPPDGPGGPCTPCIPWSPLGPCSPGSPFGPCMPSTPWSPGGPATPFVAMRAQYEGFVGAMFWLQCTATYDDPPEAITSPAEYLTVDFQLPRHRIPVACHDTDRSPLRQRTPLW